MHQQKNLRSLVMVASCFAAVVVSTKVETTVDASELRNTPVVKAIRRVSPAIVNIHGRKNVADTSYTGSEERFKPVNGMGTGVIVDPRGYILTNYHVIQGVSLIQVTFEDDATVSARLVSHDPITDLAIIKIEAKRELPVIPFGISDDIQVGEPVIAIGNAFGYRHTATEGIISRLHRTVQVSDEQTYDDLIQTSASINPGNSGGPLINIDGEMIGINVAVRVGAQGIGFAIPVNQSLDIAAELMSIERIEDLSHGVIGKTSHDGHKAKFVVRGIGKGSPAAATNLQVGDVITAVKGQRISRPLDFERALLGSHNGETVQLQVQRKSLTHNISLRLSTPAQASASQRDRSWDVLGLRLQAIPTQEFRNLGVRYRGGLKVTDVRTNGPAYKEGIRRGDILVGMHHWETVTPENVKFILNRPEIETMQPLKFYIVRGRETLYGHLRVASR